MRNLLFAALIVLPLTLPAQTITTVAGTGVQGDSGDGGPATAALLHLPEGIAYRSGIVYFDNHDHTNHRIRMIDATGVYRIYAGTGTGGFSGDGGPASAAELNDPKGLCIDKNGNLYIAEELNNIVRKITPAGIISTVAGTAGVAGYSGDGGPATAAKLSSPESVAVDTAGNVYVTDYGNYVVRKISKTGTITTFAGNGTGGYSGDGGPATAAQMERPSGVAIDTAGNVYISEDANHMIRVVRTNDTIYTYSGLLFGGFAGDGGPATAARYWSPWGLQFDSSGNLYVSDTKNNRIRKITPAGIVSTFAGDGTNSMAGSPPWGAYGGDGGAATAAQLYWPAHIGIGKSGDIYITDQSNNTIRKVDTVNLIKLTTASALQRTDAITIVPNPSNGNFTFAINLGAQHDTKLHYDVLTISGQIVQSGTIISSNGRANERISLSNSLPSGNYMLRISSGMDIGIKGFNVVR